MGDIPEKYFQRKKTVPYNCVGIDLTERDVWEGLNFNKQIRDDSLQFWQGEVNKLFAAKNPDIERAIVTLSVRSMLDLYLQVKNYPKGSEIIMTAMNIPDMIRIIREHGLIPMPVDIDVGTLAPSLD